MTGDGIVDSAFARRVEEAGLNALQTADQLFYDGWLLRVSPGSAKRARSINPHFASSLPVSRKIDHCEAQYARRSLPVLYRITPFSQPDDLVPALVARGYGAFGETVVQMLPLDRVIGGAADRSTPTGLKITTVDARRFAGIVGGMRGSTPGEIGALSDRLAHSPLTPSFVVLEHEGEAVCTAQATREDDLVGIFDVVTRADRRGRGHATYAVGALLEQASQAGARMAYLQVAVDNAPALAVYRKMGFTTLYTYCYYTPEGASP